MSPVITEWPLGAYKPMSHMEGITHNSEFFGVPVRPSSNGIKFHSVIQLPVDPV